MSSFRRLPRGLYHVFDVDERKLERGSVLLDGETLCQLTEYGDWNAVLDLDVEHRAFLVGLDGVLPKGADHSDDLASRSLSFI